MSFRANEARFHASADALHGFMRRKKPLLLSLFRKACQCLLEPTKGGFTLQLTLTRFHAVKETAASIVV